MLYVTLICVGTVKEPYLTAGIEEYKKRISSYAKFECIELKEEKIADEDDSAAVTRALEAEGEKILSRVPKGAYKIALCVEGTQYSSPDLSRLITDRCREGGRLCLVIGSSHGLAERVKSACDLRLSVSKLTFPHQLMRLMLTEILYRVLSIEAGAKYHK